MHLLKDVATERWLRRLGLLTCASLGFVLGGCISPPSLSEGNSEDFFVILDRTAIDTVRIAFPACGGELVEFGIAKHQDLGAEVSSVSHSGVTSGENAVLVVFTVSPDTLIDGSLSRSVALTENSGQYRGPLSDPADFGEIYVITGLGVAGFDLRDSVPPVGQQWMRTIDGVRPLAGNSGSVLESQVAAIECR